LWGKIKVLWKLLLAIVSGLALVITALLDYRWWDKRRWQFKKGRKALFIVLGALWIGATLSVYLNGKEREAEATRLSQQLEGLQSGQSKAAQDAEVRDQNQRNEIKKLQSMLEPFLIAARRRAPDSDDATALHSLAERLNRLELSSKDRELSPETKEKVTHVLAPFPGTKVNLQVMGGDTESRRFAEQLQQCFVEAGWTVDEFQLVFDAMFPRGLHIVVGKDSGSPQQRALEKALQATGQPVKGALNKSIAAGSLRVVVGPK
jgi:hypothetical protein